MLKKLSMMVLTVAMGLGLVACNERQVATGAAVIGSAIVAGAVYDNYNNRDYRRTRYCRGSVCYWDRYDGRYYRRGDRWYRDGRYNRPVYPNYPDYGGRMIPASVHPGASSRDSALAKKYRISKKAAREVIKAFDWVKRYGKLEGLQMIGMLDKDIQRIKRGRTPSDDSVRNISGLLGARSSSIKALLRDVHDEATLHAQGHVAAE